MDVLKGYEKDREYMGMIREKGKNGEYISVDGMLKPGTKYIAEDLVKAFNDGKVVYCRFGKQYIPNIEK